MFIGHYSAALVAKAAEPRARLWTYVGACQLLDIGWGAMILARLEKARVDPSMSGNGFDLYFMPYSHSLPASIVWALVAGFLAFQFLRLPTRAAICVGLVVFSHWPLDLIVHHPDLLIWPGLPKVGLSFWDHPVSEMALEAGLLALASAAWVARRKDQGLATWPAAAFIGLLVAVQILATLGPMASDPSSLGGMALGLYVVITLAAWPVDRSRAGAASVAGAPQLAP